MRTLYLVIGGLFFFHILAAQVTSPSILEITAKDTCESEPGFMAILNRLNVNQDPRLEKMLKWHFENNKKRDGISGYRVEIFFSSDMDARNQALKRKKEFLSKYPDYNVHIKFNAPYFRVRIGDFRTKNEALKLYKKIEKDYPGAFIVPDIIDYPLLNKEDYERSD